MLKKFTIVTLVVGILFVPFLYASALVGKQIERYVLASSWGPCEFDFVGSCTIPYDDTIALPVMMFVFTAMMATIAWLVLRQMAKG